MLNVYFGEMPEAIYNTNVYFNNTYRDRWITLPLTKQIISSVDKSEVVDERTILSPIFGNMSPKRLSGGTKTLMLIAYTDNIYNASTCGDNCAEWILEIARQRQQHHKKTVINLRHLMDFGKGDWKIKILNTGKIVNNMTELTLEVGEYV